MVAYEVDLVRLVDVLVQTNAALLPFEVALRFGNCRRRLCALAVYAKAHLLQPLRLREVGLVERVAALFALARCMGAMCFIVHLAQAQRESSDGTKAARHAEPCLSASVRRCFTAYNLVILKELDEPVVGVRRRVLTAYGLAVDLHIHVALWETVCRQRRTARRLGADHH